MEEKISKEELIQLVNERETEFIIHIEFGEEEGQNDQKESI